MGLFLLCGGITTNSQNDYLKFTTTNFPSHIGFLVSFEYPWFGNFLMFTAMSFMLILWIYQEKKNPKRSQVHFTSVKDKLMANPWIMLIASSICDLVASGMMSIGLNLGVSASIF